MIAYATLGVMLRKLAMDAGLPPGALKEPEAAEPAINGSAPMVGPVPNKTPQWFADPRFQKNTGEHARWTAPAGQGPAREVSWLPPVRDGRFQSRMSGMVHNADPNNWKSKPGTLDMTTPDMQAQFAKIKAEGSAARAARAKGATGPRSLPGYKPTYSQYDIAAGGKPVSGTAVGSGGTNAQNAEFQRKMKLLQDAGPNWRQVAAQWKKPQAVAATSPVAKPPV